MGAVASLHTEPSRYRSKMGHDVTRLGAAAVKRRYPPGMVPGQENEEITLVQSDIEGSTEIWEWYLPLPLHSQWFCCVIGQPQHHGSATLHHS